METRLDHFVLLLQPCIAGLESSLRRQVALLSTHLDEAANTLGPEKNATILKQIRDIRDSIAILLSKLRESWGYDRIVMAMFTKRLAIRHSSEAASPSSKQALLRLLAEFAGRQMRLKSANAILPHLGGIRVDIGMYEEVHHITSSLKSHSLAAALMWAIRHRSALRRVESTLEFNLRLRECADLIQSKSHDEALEYARTFLAGACTSSTGKKKVQAVIVALLQPLGSAAAGEGTPTWLELSNQFQRDFYRIHRLSTVSPLHALLQCGIQAINTPECSLDNTSSTCPLCRAFMGALPSSGLPFAYSSRSQVLCPISRRVIEGAAVVAPDGTVYDIKSLSPPDADGLVHVGEMSYPAESLQPLHII